MKTTVAMAVCCASLAACGGGGGGGNGIAAISAPATVPQAPAPAQQLAAYVGTWVSDCQDGEREVYTMSRVAADTVQMPPRTDYYTTADCSGTPTASEQETVSVKLVYAGTADATVVLPNAQMPSMVKADRLSMSIPPHASQVSGPGVTHSTQDGKTQACFTPQLGGTLCIDESDVLPAASHDAAAYVDGNEMVLLEPNGAAFDVAAHLTRTF